MSATKSLKLKFKGEKSRKKPKPLDDDAERSRKRKRAEDDGEADLDWVLPETATQVIGPSFIFHGTEPTLCISYDQTRGRISLPIITPPVKEEDSEEKGPLSALTPTEVSQVWVITRIAGSETINLRTAAGKFLSADKYGQVTADREARGPQEEWTPVILEEGMVALRTVYEKYLSLDEVAGGATSLRADSDTIGFSEKWWLKVQYGHKRKAELAEGKKDENEDRQSVDEAATNRIYQAWGAGRSVTSQSGTRDLKKARKEGRLAEALLDKRAKLKSDRFC